MFDAKKLLDCKQDQVSRACRSLFVGLVPLTGEYKSKDQAFLAIADVPRGYHTGSSQYASAESDIDSDKSMDIQSMALGLSRASHLQARMVRIKDE